MVQLDKRYFPLKEIAKRWGLRKRDLVYMAEVGELRTSVRIPGAHIEVGMLEASQDQRVRVRYERIWFTGLQDLTTEDAFLVFRNGEADVREFHTGIADEYICIMPPSPAIRLRPEHVVVRRAERDRIEAKHREAGHSSRRASASSIRPTTASSASARRSWCSESCRRASCASCIRP